MTELFRISTPLTVERLSRALGFALDDDNVDPEDVIVRHRNGCLVFETINQPLPPQMTGVTVAAEKLPGA